MSAAITALRSTPRRGFHSRASGRAGVMLLLLALISGAAPRAAAGSGSGVPGSVTQGTTAQGSVAQGSVAQGSAAQSSVAPAATAPPDVPPVSPDVRGIVPDGPSAWPTLRPGRVARPQAAQAESLHTYDVTHYRLDVDIPCVGLNI